MVSGTAFVDTAPHHAASGDRSVIHPVASRKGGPRRRETHRAVVAKHLPRYLGAFAWRFNRRFVLKTIYERLAIAAAATPPMPYRLLKLAEARW